MSAIQKLIVLLKQMVGSKPQSTQKKEFLDLPYYENPYLPQIREIIENVLKEKKISYADFAPILVDGKDSEKTLSAAEVLSRDLNHITILTENRAYFENYADNMYEEQGLIVEIFPKKETNFLGNAILDFEQDKDFIRQFDFKEKLYIPIFKRKWESAGNLDIAVPIGYNTVIVRGSKIEKKQPHLDKFEQAFYDNE